MPPPSLAKRPAAEQPLHLGNFDIVTDAKGQPIVLGKGTFGRTYQARHRFLDIPVALKIINERYAADATVRQRFLVEARAVAKLSHPHVARLYDFGEVDGLLHYAMEFCGGGSLADRVTKTGPLPLRQVFEIAQQIGGALKAAHTAGFVHRDLKPSNIMLASSEGAMQSKLIDFGLVQPSMPSMTRTFSDEESEGARFLGTPLYASPEQLREEAVDVRTDLFSLGLTLWFLLLGHTHETGSSAEIAASRLNSESYAPMLPPEIPQAFRDVLARLVEKQRGNRFNSASELFASLNACASAVGARPARDYTESEDDGPEDVSAAETAAPEVSSAADPLHFERVGSELTTAFEIVGRSHEDLTGANYLAKRISGDGANVYLHVLHAAVLEHRALVERIRANLAQLSRLNMPALLPIRALMQFSDHTTVVMERPAEEDLLTFLRNRGAVTLPDAAPFLQTVAGVSDQLIAANLPVPHLSPARITLKAQTGTDGGRSNSIESGRLQLVPRFLTAADAPELTQDSDDGDVSLTMTTDMLSDPERADNATEHFATLLYRIVANRNCPVAASLSSHAYVPIPGLSEQANRLLALAIANQYGSVGCSQLLRDILTAEGVVARVPGHPTAGFTGRSPDATSADTRTSAFSSSGSTSFVKTPPKALYPKEQPGESSHAPVLRPAPPMPVMPVMRAEEPPVQEPVTAKQTPPVISVAPKEQKVEAPPAAPPEPKVSAVIEPAAAVVPPPPVPAPPVTPPPVLPVKPAQKRAPLLPKQETRTPKEPAQATPPVLPVVVAAAAVTPQPKAPPPAPVPPPPVPATRKEARAPIDYAAKLESARQGASSLVSAAQGPLAQIGPYKKPIAIGVGALVALTLAATIIPRMVHNSREGQRQAASAAAAAPAQKEAAPPAATAAPQPVAAATAAPVTLAPPEVWLEGPLPKHARAEVAGIELPLRPNGNRAQVDFGQKAPNIPFEMHVAAPGYQAAAVAFQRADDLKRSYPVNLVREQGNLAFQRKGATAYTAADVKMVEPLPGQAEDVSVDPAPRRVDLNANAPVALPTGVYELTFGPAAPQAGTPPVRVAITAAATQSVDVPESGPTIVGTTQAPPPITDSNAGQKQITGDKANSGASGGGSRHSSASGNNSSQATRTQHASAPAPAPRRPAPAPARTQAPARRSFEGGVPGG